LYLDEQVIAARVRVLYDKVWDKVAEM